MKAIVQSFRSISLVFLIGGFGACSSKNHSETPSQEVQKNDQILSSVSEKTIDSSDNYFSVAKYSPDGKWVFVPGRKTCKIVQVNTGESFSFSGAPDSDTAPSLMWGWSYTPYFSPDSEFLIQSWTNYSPIGHTLGESRAVTVFGPLSSQKPRVRKIPLPGQEMLKVQFDAKNGEFLAVSREWEQKKDFVVFTRFKESDFSVLQQKKFSLETPFINQVAISEDTKTVVIKLGNDKGLKVARLDDWENVKFKSIKVSKEKSDPSSFFLAPDGKYLALVYTRGTSQSIDWIKELSLVDLESDSLRAQSFHSDSPSDFKLADRVWDSMIDGKEGESVQGFNFLEDGQALFFQPSVGFQKFDLVSREAQLVLSADVWKQIGATPINEVLVSKDSNRIFLQHRGQFAVILDLSAERIMRTDSFGQSNGYILDVSPDGKHYLTTSRLNSGKTVLVEKELPELERWEAIRKYEVIN